MLVSMTERVGKVSQNRSIGNPTSTYVGHDSLIRLLLGLHENSLALLGCELTQIHCDGDKLWLKERMIRVVQLLPRIVVCVFCFDFAIENKRKQVSSCFLDCVSADFSWLFRRETRRCVDVQTVFWCKFTLLQNPSFFFTFQIEIVERRE